MEMPTHTRDAEGNDYVNLHQTFFKFDPDTYMVTNVGCFVFIKTKDRFGKVYEERIELTSWDAAEHLQTVLMDLMLGNLDGTED